MVWGAQMEPKMAHLEPKMVHLEPKMAQLRPKMAQERLQIALPGAPDIPPGVQSKKGSFARSYKL